MYAYLERLYVKFIVSLIIKHSQGLFRSTLRNCVRLDGSISSKRTWGEIRRLFKFGVVLLIIPLFFMAVNGMAVYFVHNYMIPIPIATDIFSVFDIDPVVWKIPLRTKHWVMWAHSTKSGVEERVFHRKALVSGRKRCGLIGYFSHSLRYTW